jgi:hypothetical protein
LPGEPSDTPLHVFRIAELGYGLRDGDPYPRWAPDFVYGYGLPLFNFYAPLAYYAANLATFANPQHAVSAAKVIFVGSLLCAGMGMFLLVQAIAGRWAGIVAAATYLFAPYVFLIDPHLRGDLPESLALGVAPLFLWSVRAYGHQMDRRCLVIASLLTAALILSHNLAGVMIFVLGAGNILWRSLFESNPPGSSLTSTVWKRSLPLAVGVGLSAFFWLPVVLERYSVQLERIVGPAHYRYRNHFLKLQEILAPSLALDLGSSNPEVRFNLGVGQWLLAAAGLVAVVFVAYRDLRAPSWTLRRCAHLHDGIYWGLSLIGLCFLMTSLSEPVWRALPPMAFVLFPWRFLGPAALCAAILAGYCTLGTRPLPWRWQQWTCALLLAVPLLAAVPTFVPPQWRDFGPTDRRAMLELELKGIALGTTAAVEYLPSTVRRIPQPDPNMLEDYHRGQTVDRVDRRMLPEGASVKLVTSSSAREEYFVTSPSSLTLRLQRFMYAGWRAAIDGSPAPLHADSEEGFMALQMPAGDHAVTVWLGTTGPRALGWALTCATLCALLIGVARMPSGGPSPQTLERFSALHGFVVVAGAALSLALGNGLGLLQPNSTGLVVTRAEHSLHRLFGDDIDLLGYDLQPASPVLPSTQLRLTLYWKARQTVTTEYGVFVHLIDSRDRILAQSDKMHPAEYPTTRWGLEKYVRDVHVLALSADIAAGVYTLRVGLSNSVTGGRLQVSDDNGTQLGDSVRLPADIILQPPA